MVFYVVNSTKSPIRVTIDKKWSLEHPNAFTITLSKKPIDGVHATAFSLHFDTPYPVVNISETPEPLHIDDRLKVNWKYFRNNGGDLIFQVVDFLS
jgi:hypothetical protein